MEVGKTYYCKWEDELTYFINKIDSETNSSVKGKCVQSEKNYGYSPKVLSFNKTERIGTALIVEVTLPFNKKRYPEFFI